MAAQNTIIPVGVHGFKGSEVQRFKGPFSSLDCIWDAYLREKRQLRQAQSKIWSQIGGYLGKRAFSTRTSGIKCLLYP